MRILSVNCGSSSLKFDLFEASGPSDSPRRIASGLADRLGAQATISLRTGGQQSKVEKALADHGEAMQSVLAQLKEHDLLAGIDAVGHRVVHGGPKLRAPVVVDEAVVAAIEAVSELAPLHNDAALAAIRAAQDWFGTTRPMVATFDTAFFAELPEVAQIYALPTELSQKHSIRRYGFHGLAHRYMVERFRELRPQLAHPRVITLQLGNGCSATASVDGKAVDTSMGFTPLDGLIMGTRSGDLDPMLPSYIAEKEGISREEVESLLNRRSGLLGLSGRSSDMRDLLDAEQAGDERSSFAVDAFCYRVRKYIGAYLATLGGADGIVFGGGIGENSSEVRRRICEGMEWTGIRLNQDLNDSATGRDALISDDSVGIIVGVIRVDEARIIAEDAHACVRR